MCWMVRGGKVMVGSRVTVAVAALLMMVALYPFRLLPLHRYLYSYLASVGPSWPTENELIPLR